jgi:phage tail sheath protein FI
VSSPLKPSAILWGRAEPLEPTVRRHVPAESLAAGALQGARLEEAYVARCDRTTMTQDDIDRGHIVVLVAFAPLTPAEFEIIRIQQRTGQPQT